MKVRCKQCGQFFLKEQIEYSLPIGNICSKACLDEKARTRPRSSSASHSANESRRTRDRSTRVRAGGRPKKVPSVASIIPRDVRDHVTERDHGGCRWCGSRRGVHLHHIRYRSQGGKHIENNLICLCLHHHQEVHSDKRRYQPILLELLDIQYETGKFLFVPQVERGGRGEISDRDESDG